MKIALIGPGLTTIPPKKFGAIEMILWNYKQELGKIGHEVVIFNDQNLGRVAQEINFGNFDFVQLNYSEYVSYFLKKLKVPFCTTCHSGYITNRKKWSIGYHSVFYDSMKCPGIIALSEDIKKMYLASGYKGFIRVIRNGIDTKNFTLQGRGNGRAICLGRVEPRKRQAWLAKLLAHKQVPLDFVGVVEDPAFKAEGACRYIGQWTKPEVYQKLSEYSCLVLLSDGEAAPLVVPEALAAGLSVVVSRSAAANLDDKLPFVTILPDELSDSAAIAESVTKQIEKNESLRQEILSYAQKYFDNNSVVADFIEAAKEFNHLKPSNKKSFSMPWKKVPVYFVSKLAVLTKAAVRNLKLSLGFTSQP